ncbi:MAG: hypothetical protein JAY74_17865 [Candidatus Thiodiazotropha taylori]|nr:hypothetical protein [Candidatus Thiodiazotropha taylori]
MNTTKSKQTRQLYNFLFGLVAGADVPGECHPCGLHTTFPLAFDKPDHPLPERNFPTAV